MKSIKQINVYYTRRLFKNKSKTRVYECTCGKEFKVHTNVYDTSDSGQGSCDCGECRVIIN